MTISSRYPSLQEGVLPLEEKRNEGIPQRIHEVRGFIGLHRPLHLRTQYVCFFEDYQSSSERIFPPFPSRWETSELGPQLLLQKATVEIPGGSSVFGIFRQGSGEVEEGLGAKISFDPLVLCS